MANEKTKVNNLDAANISSSTLIANTTLVTDASKNIISIANGAEGTAFKIVGGVPAWTAQSNVTTATNIDTFAYTFNGGF